MKRRYLLSMVTCLGFMLIGCGTQIGISGKAREDYLESIKPYLQYWEKPGMTSEGRRSDSMSCGVGNTDDVGFGQASIKAAQRSGESEYQTRNRLLFAWERCMLKEGYRFTGECSYKKANPACGAQ